MKKLMILALGLAVAGLAACGESPSPSPTPTPTPTPEKYSDKVLAISEGSVHAVGGWTADNWAAKDENKMEATSVKAVSELSTAVADKLVDKQLEYLYKREVQIGTEKAGWDAKCKVGDDIYVADGSYTLKALTATYDDEEETYIAGQWIPDPHTAHAEALNENLFFPSWTEEADEDGFAWDQNPVVIGGAGTYVQVVAKYKAVSAPDVAGFGMAMIKKSAADPELAQKFEKYVPPSTDVYGICGSMTGWGVDAEDMAMTLKDDVYTIKLELEANDEFKIRVNGSWDKCYGAAAVSAESPALENFDVTADNIKCTTGGLYTVVFDPVEEEITLDLAAADVYTIIGSMTDWTTDIDMQEESGVFSAEINLAEGDQFKIRLNKDWAVSFGYEALDPTCECYENFANEGGNIKTLAADSYEVTFTVATQTIGIAIID